MRKNVYFVKMKRFIKMSLFIISFAISIHVVAQDIETGLMVHYTFDDVSGTTVPDNTGNGWAGFLQGAAAVDVGYLGSSVSCPDATDYILLPNDVFQSVTDFTFAAWVKVNSLGNWSRIFDVGQTDQSNDSYFTTNQGGGAPKYTIYRNGGTDGYLDVISNTSFPTGSWVHVAITLEGGTTGSMYFNGTLVGSGTYNMNAGTETSITLADMGDVSTITNYIAKSHWDDAGLNGKIDDVRIYTRALSIDDINVLASEQPQTELFIQWNNLDLGDISEVISDITLPTTLGSQGVEVSWETSSKYISNTGVVTRHSMYDMPVDLVATVSQPGVTTETLEKTFTAIVKGEANLVPGIVAEWDFSTDNIFLDGDTLRVTDISGNNFVGKLMDVAGIRTIGESTQYNVLDLGNNEGYFDMGTAIGEAVYSLKNFSVGGFYRMDDTYADNTAWGNNIFSFSNSEYVMTDPNGTMYICLGNSNYGISPDAWNVSGENGVNPSLHPDKGTWHHIMYVQKDGVGTIYVDGVEIQSGGVGHIPYNTLYRDTLSGTPFNWIGRPPYKPSSDVFLRNTLVYDFTLINVNLTADDVAALASGELLGVGIDDLNTAYAENPNYVSSDLENEKNNLNLGDLSNVTSDLTLPTQGTLNPDIEITWSSEAPGLVSPDGVVTQRYFASTTYITATLTDPTNPLGGKVDTTFTVTVPASGEAWFTNDLYVKYDFTQVNGDVVTDVAEKNFEGQMMNGASIRTIGLEGNTFDVLDLGSDNGYFDMGVDMGEIMYHIKDYTMGAYYLIDTSNTTLGNNGNFVWALSNSADAATGMNGYIFGRATTQEQNTSPVRWEVAKGVGVASQPSKGEWHHLGYVQKDTIGTLYIDGAVYRSDSTMTYIPDSTLTQDGRFGTFYNWLGRPCFASDSYLQKSLIYDYRLYGRALTDAEVAETEMDVVNTLALLNAAYEANPNIPDAIKPVTLAKDKYTILSGAGKIRILGLGNEQVSVYNLAGQKMLNDAGKNEIAVSSGIYIVKIGTVVKKVIVK